MSERERRRRSNMEEGGRTGIPDDAILDVARAEDEVGPLTLLLKARQGRFQVEVLRGDRVEGIIDAGPPITSSRMVHGFHATRTATRVTIFKRRRRLAFFEGHFESPPVLGLTVRRGSELLFFWLDAHEPLRKIDHLSDPFQRGPYKDLQTELTLNVFNVLNSSGAWSSASVATPSPAADDSPLASIPRQLELQRMARLMLRLAESKKSEDDWLKQMKMVAATAGVADPLQSSRPYPDWATPSSGPTSPSRDASHVERHPLLADGSESPEMSDRAARLASTPPPNSEARRSQLSVTARRLLALDGRLPSPLPGATYAALGLGALGSLAGGTPGLVAAAVGGVGGLAAWLWMITGEGSWRRLRHD